MNDRLKDIGFVQSGPLEYERKPQGAASGKLATAAHVFTFMRSLGYSFVCSSCEHMYAAVLDGRGSCGVRECCGPAFGGVFQKYSGPADIENVCFVCGKEPSAKVVVDGFTRTLALCSAHVDTLNARVVNIEAIG